MKLSDEIWKRLTKEVGHVFYLPGGGCAPLVIGLGASKLTAVSCLHEQGAGFAALAYAQHKGFGVCLVTSGPGVTNVLTPCLAAWVDSVPMLIISGQVMTKWIAFPGMRSRGTQEAPTVALARPITKWAALADDAANVLPLLDAMIAKAKDKRPGPVWLDVPMEVQNAEL